MSALKAYSFVIQFVMNILTINILYLLNCDKLNFVFKKRSLGKILFFFYFNVNKNYRHIYLIMYMGERFT